MVKHKLPRTVCRKDIVSYTSKEERVWSNQVTINQDPTTNERVYLMVSVFASQLTQVDKQTPHRSIDHTEGISLFPASSSIMFFNRKNKSPFPFNLIKHLTKQVNGSYSITILEPTRLPRQLALHVVWELWRTYRSFSGFRSVAPANEKDKYDNALEGDNRRPWQ